MSLPPMLQHNLPVLLLWTGDPAAAQVLLLLLAVAVMLLLLLVQLQNCQHLFHWCNWLCDQ